MRQRMANGVTKSFTGLSSQSVQGSIEPLSNSVIQRAETMASHHTQTTGRTEKIDQAGATVQNLREIKKVLAEIAATNREQLDAFQKERAEIEVEEYLELRLTNNGGDSPNMLFRSMIAIVALFTILRMRKKIETIIFSYELAQMLLSILFTHRYCRVAYLLHLPEMPHNEYNVLLYYSFRLL
ncbi:hypothetical protein FOC4_g10012261 [Fusarium odoratissimum]|uniref:Uncharacterized protein n=1 Tax=Fusarium oxysporum f. sp. cubense (strain race 4) TaxID=2502994 RepID=N1RFP6_FUSC4|nr:hypothetical protein FOC4_g10012261 [Fusarium odoratissimum]